MPLKTFVKASAITNLSDARYFSAFPVNWMSFQCNPVSKKYVPHNTIQEMAGWLEGPEFCLEVAGLDSETIAQLLQEVDVQGVEYESGQVIPDAVAEKYTIFQRIYIDKLSSVESLTRQISNETDYIILDFQLNQLSLSQLQNNDLNISVADLNKLANNNAILISMDFRQKDIDELLKWNTDGLDIQGGEEEKVGLRSFEDIQDVMDSLDEWS